MFKVKKLFTLMLVALMLVGLCVPTTVFADPTGSESFDAAFSNYPEGNKMEWNDSALTLKTDADVTALDNFIKATVNPIVIPLGSQEVKTVAAASAMPTDTVKLGFEDGSTTNHKVSEFAQYVIANHVTPVDIANDADKYQVEDLANLTETELSGAITFIKNYVKANWTGASDVVQDVYYDATLGQFIVKFTDNSGIGQTKDKFLAQKPKPMADTTPKLTLTDENKVVVKDMAALTVAELDSIYGKLKQHYTDQSVDVNTLTMSYDAATTTLTVKFSDNSNHAYPLTDIAKAEEHTIADVTAKMTDIVKTKVKDMNALTEDEKTAIKAALLNAYIANGSTNVKEIAVNTDVKVTFVDDSFHTYALLEVAEEAPQQLIADTTNVLTSFEKIKVADLENLTDAEKAEIKTALINAYTNERSVTPANVNFGSPDADKLTVLFTDGSGHTYNISFVAEKKAEEPTQSMAEQNPVTGPTQRLEVSSLANPNAQDLSYLNLHVKNTFKEKGFDHVASVNFKYNENKPIEVVFTDGSSTRYEANVWMVEKAAPASKEHLKELIGKVYDKLNDSLNPLSNLEYFNLKIAYDKAVAVNSKADATSAEIKAAEAELEKALGLDLKAPIDRAEIDDLLKKAYDQLQDWGTYTGSSTREEVRKAYDEAYAIYRDPTKGQKDIDKACQKLRKVLGIPEPLSKPLDRSKLDEIIRFTYQKLTDGASTMAREDYNRIKAEYDRAFKVYKDNSATQKQIDKATARLSKVMGVEGITITRPTERKELGALIQQAYNQLISGTMSAADYANLKYAYDEANRVYSDSNASQEAINNAAAKLRAYMGIVEKPAEVESLVASSGMAATNARYTLKKVLDIAYTKLTSKTEPLTKDDFARINVQYQEALKVYNNPLSSDTSMNDAISKLKTAMGILDIPVTADNMIPVYAIFSLSLLGLAALAMYSKRKSSYME